MTRQSGKTVIGLFVIGAIILVVAGIITFGSGKLFTPTRKYVMYFDGSVKGLSVGAAVAFRGVKIGSVIDISLEGDLQHMSFKVPVIVEVDLKRFHFVQTGTQLGHDDQALINRGIRAQLQPQSLLTGQLVIDIDFRPDRPARLISDATGYPQIPTVPSAFSELAQKLDELPLQQLFERVHHLVSGLDTLVNSPEIAALPKKMNLTLDESRILVGTIERQIALLSAEAGSTLESAATVLDRIDRAFAFQEGPTGELAGNIKQLLDDMHNSLGLLNETLATIKNAVPDERSKYEFRRSLKGLGETIRSLNALVQYLNEHPETLLRGKTAMEDQ